MVGGPALLAAGQGRVARTASPGRIARRGHRGAAGQRRRVVLIDLGLATRPGRIERGLGTDGYAVPEQDAGGTVAPATDVWGLAATLFECVTGAAPGREPDVSRVPAWLRPLLADCLRADPAARPGPAEVRDRLDALLAEPVTRWWWPLRRAAR